MTPPSRTVPLVGGLSLLMATTAAVFALTDVGVGDAGSRPSATPQPGGVLRLGGDQRFPADAIPTVARARRTDQLGRLSAAAAKPRCPSAAVDLGTWCLDRDVRGTANFAVASRVCVTAGGFLPTAAQLTGTAPRVRLSGRLDDRPSTALVDPGRRHDLREMSATTITTATGSRSAGSPTTPLPPTLQFVTVTDNRDRGGFAGAVPVGTDERFRCAYFKRQGALAPDPKAKIRGVVLASRRQLRVTTQVPVAGRLAVALTVGSGAKQRSFGSATVRLTKARTLDVRVRPTAAGRRALHPGRRTSLTVHVRVRTTSGALITTTRAVRVAVPRS